MTNKQLSILAIVAVVMVGWAVVQSQIADRSADRDATPSYLIGSLNVDEIASIRVFTNHETIELKRAGNGFTLASRSGYPAKTGEVNNIITASMDLKPAALVTANPENHAALKVTDETARCVVSFFGAGDDGSPKTQPVAGFFLSPRDEEGGNVYARKMGEDKVYRLEEDTFPRPTTMSFVESEIASVERDKIQSVTVSQGDASYTLKRGDDGEQIVLEAMPEGKQLKGSLYKSVFEAMSSLRVDDVKPATEQTEKLDFAHKYVCRLDDSTVYTLAIAPKDDQYYMTCTAEFTGDARVTMTQGKVESEEELKKKEATLLAADNAATFAKKHQGWLYEIPSWKAQNLTKALDDLLEDAEKPAEETENSQSPADETSAPEAATPPAADAAGADESGN